jgi:uncharacterized protein YukE
MRNGAWAACVLALAAVLRPLSAATEARPTAIIKARASVTHSLDELKRCSADAAPALREDCKRHIVQVEGLLQKADEAAARGAVGDALAQIRQAAQDVRKQLARCKQKGLQKGRTGEGSPRSYRRVREELTKLIESLRHCSAELVNAAGGKEREKALREIQDLARKSETSFTSGRHREAVAILRQAIALARRAFATCRRQRRALASAAPSASPAP